MDPQRPLLGRAALVCGASRGIGRAAAIALANAGAHVVVLARNQPNLEALADEIEEAGGLALPVVADLDDRDGLEVAVTQAIADVGPLTILINNTAGPKGGRLLDAEEDQLLSAFSRHVLSAHRLVRLLLPGMQAEGYGRIINVVSTSVREPIPGLGVSNTVRGAMASWAKTLSRELPPGVTINNVLPGYTDTDRLTELRQGRAKREGVSDAVILEQWKAAVPEGRLARPEETAAAILFLASPAAAYIRGVSLPVDGGRLRGI
jgi:3-oxoacyl-[acyl-carrier protein] reductase